MTPAQRLQYAGAMSRERFVQEAAIAAMHVILTEALRANPVLNEERSAALAKLAIEVGYAMDEEYGVNSIPTKGE
jgi:hypothetical protein